MNPQTPPLTEYQHVQKRLFAQIYPRYDLMNHILSLGQDFFWRSKLAKAIPSTANLILDIATGTGDLALKIFKSNRNRKLIGIDLTPEMLAIARTKSVRKRVPLDLIVADALKLPFPDGVFDIATVAFGLRNFPDYLAGIKEMKRVVKRGGKVMILEMTFSQDLKLRGFFSCYLDKFIPFMGGLVAGDRKAYQYLSTSIREFPTSFELSEMMKSAGLTEVKMLPLTFGITYLHQGTVP